MFIGHYGVGLALRRAGHHVSLGWLFIAVQLVDILWAVFVILGVEKLRIVPGLMAASSLDLYYMPYTHSLAGTVFWAVAFGAVYAYASGASEKFKLAVVMAAAVASHFVLDIIVHGPDQLLLGDSKIGMGLWGSRMGTYLVEAAVLLAGIIAYVSLSSTGRHRLRAVAVFTVFLLIVNLVNIWGQTVSSPKLFAVEALAFYALFAAAAFWLDRGRATPRRSSA